MNHSTMFMSNRACCVSIQTETVANYFKAFLISLMFVLWGAGFASAQGGPEEPSLFITCPLATSVECGSQGDLDLTGTPTVDGNLPDMTLSITYADNVVPGNNCEFIIMRTWTASIGELTESCTQYIQVVDTQGPVFSPINNLTVQCLEEVPAFENVVATDGCAGGAEVQVFESNTGDPEVDCLLYTAFGPGADWAVWLPVLASNNVTTSALFEFDSNGGHFVQFSDGTAHLFGTVQNSTNNAQKFVVDLWFQNKADWTTWSGLGRNYKNDLGLPCATGAHTNWNYYELVGGLSTLTGAGSMAGNNLNLYHMPSNYYFGFQAGIGANNKNCNSGLSGWFSYNGVVNGQSVSGHGDVNVDTECEPIINNDDDCDHHTTISHFYFAQDACGNSTSIEQVITVHDDTAPVFSNCPESLVIECDEEVPGVPEGITATDNCTGLVTVLYLGSTSQSDICFTTITRRWSAADICGNIALCEQTISIVDTTAPVLSGTPAEEITVQCDAVPEAANVTVTDNCDVNVELFYTADIAEGNCPGNYTIYRMWYASDICGNTNTFLQTVHVIDTTPPVFDPYEFYAHIECNEIAGSITAHDNCGEATVEITYEILNSGGCMGVYHRIYTATDACGNTATAEQYISILDNTPPVLVGIGGEAELECNDVIVGEDGNFFDNGGVYGMDNCGMEVTISYSEEVVATDDNCPQSFDIVRTWIATDYCENVSTGSQLIHVVDTTAPMLYIPADYSAECDEELVYDDALAYDNCGAAFVSSSLQIVPGNCPNNYTVVRTFTATDECGNTTAPQVQTITVSDNYAPMFSYEQPYMYTYECDAIIPVIQPSATDNCSDDIVYAYSDTDFWGTSCYNGFTRIWTAIDECGNDAEFNQYITIQDTTGPVITGEAEITKPCDDFEGTFVTATDNCNEFDIYHWDEHVSGSCAGNIIRHYTAYDYCQNGSEEFIQIIHLTDAVAPVIEFAIADFTIECGSLYVITAPVFSDNCDENLEITPGFSSVLVDCITIETYTFTAVDHCGNTTVSTTVVTIIDTLNPWFENFPADEQVNCDEELPAIVYPQAYDICDSNVDIYYTEEILQGNCPAEQYILRMFRAVDDCGNQVLETQTIHVVDLEAPYFDYEASQLNLSYECDQDAEVIAPITYDNCSTFELTYEDSQEWTEGCYFGFTRVWTATDACGNAASVSQGIFFQDTTAPVVNPYEIAISMPCDQVINAVLISATDNCNEVIITYTDEHLSGGCAGHIIRTYSVSDICGNQTQGLFIQIITLTDTVAPVIVNAPSDLIVECGDEYPAYEPIWNDNCDDELMLSAISGIAYDGCNQIISQVFFAEDHCGNQSSVSRMITIIDTTAPILSNLPADAEYDCSEEFGVANVTAYDVCNGELEVLHSDVIIPGNCPQTYTIERTFRAHDLCGNEAVYTQTISVSDETAPEFTYVPEGGYFSCEVGAPFEQATAQDDCSTFEVTYTDETLFTTIDVDFSETSISLCGTLITRNWLATDACGNTSTATSTYFVYDNVAPTFDQELSNVTVECASEIPAPVEVTATDNCTTAVVSVDTEVLESDDCGNQLIEVTYTAVDECGNTAYTSYFITVLDETDPTLIGCPSNLVLACDEEVPAAAQVSATDNCDQIVNVDFEEFIIGDMPAPGSIADCDLITPVRPANNPCVYPYDWAMALFGMPSAHKWYAVSAGNLVQYPNGSIHLQATLNNVMNPANGWFVDVWFAGGMDWSQWSSQAFPTGFKADCGGEAINHTAWTYFLMQAGEGAELTGFGAYAGSSLNTVHAPANNYFGFQLGDGANNYNGADNGFGGWFTYSGIFNNASVSGAGDFAFELDCCPDYYIVRQWTAVDCSGNASTCVQNITFAGSAGPVNAPVQNQLTNYNERAISNLSVYPNPATTRALFTFTSKNDSMSTLEIYDMTGSKVADVFIGVVEAGIEYKVDYNISKLATGIYTYRLTNGSDFEVGRLVIGK